MSSSEPAAKRLRLSLPERPQVFLASTASAAFHDGLRQVLDAVAGEGERRDAVLKPCRALRSEAEAGLRRMLEGELYDVAAAQAGLGTLLGALEGCPEWMRNMQQASNCVAALGACVLLDHFLRTGVVASRAASGLSRLSTSEYLLALMRFADELETYAVGRALWLDRGSVWLTRGVLRAINEQLMLFNFRNGALRRRFDAVKYRVRRLENMSYELALVGVGGAEAQAQLPAEREPAELLDVAELQAMSAELDRQADDREVVIKATREPQKNSKKAIYCLHRAQRDEARALLQSVADQCRQIAQATQMSRSELHGGSFGAALEEYAEARLLEHWLASGDLLPLSQLQAEVDISEKDYLGGVVDFTGEIGRWGVARATDRDVDAVKRVLACDLAIKEYAIQLAELGAGKLTKKLEAVATNTKKMEATLYELTLSAASGDRRMLLSSVEEPPAPDGGRGGGADGDDGNNNAEH
jgi:predicted translin family RNA/ssDNA-binding protein